MVDVILTTLEKDNPQHCYIAARVGNIQKLGRLSAERHYRFPQEAVSKHKCAFVDVFQRIGGCTVNLEGEERDQLLTMPMRSGENLRLHVNVASGSGELKEGERAKSSDKLSDATRQKLISAKSYLTKHNLELRLKVALQAAMEALPEDPAAFIAKKLAETRDPPTQLSEEVAPAPPTHNSMLQQPPESRTAHQSPDAPEHVPRPDAPPREFGNLAEVTVERTPEADALSSRLQGLPCLTSEEAQHSEARSQTAATSSRHQMQASNRDQQNFEESAATTYSHMAQYLQGNAQLAAVLASMPRVEFELEFLSPEVFERMLAEAHEGQADPDPTVLQYFLESYVAERLARQ